MPVVVRWLAVLAVLALVGGCAGGEPRGVGGSQPEEPAAPEAPAEPPADTSADPPVDTPADPPADTPSGAPDEPPPALEGVRSPPPPAWVETPDGATWLAFGSSCWQGSCVMGRPPEQRTDLPELLVPPGTELRFRLQFPAATLELDLDSERIQLTGGESATWTVGEAGGVLWLRATPEGGGSVLYHARLVVG